jgi:hypothetical protein
MILSPEGSHCQWKFRKGIKDNSLVLGLFIPGCERVLGRGQQTLAHNPQSGPLSALCKQFYWNIATLLHYVLSMVAFTTRAEQWQQKPHGWQNLKYLL